MTLPVRAKVKTMMATWGVCVHYCLKALSLLPDVSTTCYRGFPARDRDAILVAYKKGRPVQWAGFTSTTTDLATARSFAGEGGVICKLDVQSGRDVGPISFFPTENELLLSPNHKFIVTSETGGYEQDGHICINLLEMEGVWLFDHDH